MLSPSSSLLVTGSTPIRCRPRLGHHLWAVPVNSRAHLVQHPDTLPSPEAAVYTATSIWLPVWQCIVVGFCCSLLAAVIVAHGGTASSQVWPKACPSPCVFEAATRSLLRAPISPLRCTRRSIYCEMTLNITKPLALGALVHARSWAVDIWRRTTVHVLC